MADAEEQAVQLLHELVTIDSVNPGLVPSATGETAILEYLRARLERSGFECTLGEGPEVVGSSIALLLAASGRWADPADLTGEGVPQLAARAAGT